MRVTVRVDLPNGRQLGPGKARLLELVADHGSITAAGKAMGMSYRRAWLLIEDLNTSFDGKLVDAKPGGAGGGGATLTELGRHILAAYRAIEARTGSSPELALLQSHLAPGRAPDTGS